MKKLFIAAIMSLSLLTTSTFAEIKIGIILGFTGPIESLTPAMRDSAKLAFQEASDSGALLGGETIAVLEADSTCVDSAAATTAAEGLVAAGVTAIMGADCSGVTGAIITNVAVPNGIVMISPSATSPGLTDAKDKKLFFRTAPSDARGGAVSGALIGVVLALLTWTSVAAGESPTGTVDISSLGGAFPMLYGNVVAILSSGLICVVVSLGQRKVYDWKEMNTHMIIVEADMSDKIKAEIAQRAQDEATLEKAYKFSLKGGGILTIICVVLWPLPLYFSGYVFDLGFYSMWVGIAIVWVSCAAFCIICMPIWEARGGFAAVFSGKKATA